MQGMSAGGLAAGCVTDRLPEEVRQVDLALEATAPLSARVRLKILRKKDQHEDLVA